jgi:hypothetical protein
MIENVKDLLKAHGGLERALEEELAAKLERKMKQGERE